MIVGRLTTAAASCVLLIAVALPAELASQAADASRPVNVQPRRTGIARSTASLRRSKSIQKHLVAGADAFPEEKTAQELAGRLNELGARLRERPSGAPALDWLLAPEFRGGRLTSSDEVSLGNSPQLEIFRARTMPAELVRDRTSFGKELTDLVSDFDSVQMAEFLITAIDVESGPEAGGPHGCALRPHRRRQGAAGAQSGSDAGRCNGGRTPTVGGSSSNGRPSRPCAVAPPRPSSPRRPRRRWGATPLSAGS